ncbi:uncharacterized protein [Elaeis guineensis]|uniref:uncharacterized protein n=1 Tax=Elaeis guineensis var. tenera TaxID=51953 RepID=UPI003C6D3BBE
MASGDEGRSAGGSADFPLPEGASGLANHDLARRLCQALLLPADIEAMKNQRVSDMLSSFYPMMIRLVFNISELEAGYRKFGDMRAAWRDKVAGLEAEKAILLDQFQQSVDRENRLEGEVSRFSEEISGLKEAKASLESELKSAKDDAAKKSRTIRRLRHERDSVGKELEGEREQLRASLENLAKAEEGHAAAQADADVAKAESESAKEALGRAVEVFRDSEEYREELLESGYLSYQVGFTNNILSTAQQIWLQRLGGAKNAVKEYIDKTTRDESSNILKTASNIQKSMLDAETEKANPVTEQKQIPVDCHVLYSGSNKLRSRRQGEETKGRREEESTGGDRGRSKQIQICLPETMMDLMVMLVQ